MKRKPNKRGILLVIIGLLLLIIAAGWQGFNFYTDRKAGETAARLLQEMNRQITLSDPEQPLTESTVTVDGDRFCGQILIEKLNLQLPVYHEWSMAKLENAPCRYGGSTSTDDLIIAGHNYKSHFAALYQLQPGDELFFLDPSGTKHRYTVQEITLLDGSDVAHMNAGDWDLTLFTCTYGGKQRITVRCLRAS